MIKQEGLYQNMVNSSLGSIHNCKMAYLNSIVMAALKAQSSTRQLLPDNFPLPFSKWVFTLIPRERLKSLKRYDKNGFESYEGTEKLLLEWKHLFEEALLAIRLNIRLVIGFKNTGTYQGYI